MTRAALPTGLVITATNGVRLTIKGKWAMDAAIAVAETDDGWPVHIYQTGYCPDLGRDVWASAEHKRAFEEYNE